MVTDASLQNRIQRIHELPDEDAQIDELMDLGEAIRFENTSALDRTECDTIVEWIKKSDHEPLLTALWLALMSGDCADSACDLAVQAIKVKSTRARSAAALFLEIKFPGIYETMLADLVADLDSNIAFRASVQMFSKEPSKLISKIVAHFPNLSFDNFDEAMELTRLYGGPENVPALLSAFGKQASNGDIRDLVDELRNRRT